MTLIKKNRQKEPDFTFIPSSDFWGEGERVVCKLTDSRVQFSFVFAMLPLVFNKFFLLSFPFPLPLSHFFGNGREKQTGIWTC